MMSSFYLNMTKDELQAIRERSIADTAEDDGHGWPNQAEYSPEYMRTCINDRAALLAYIDGAAHEPGDRLTEARTTLKAIADTPFTSGITAVKISAQALIQRWEWEDARAAENRGGEHG